MHIYILDCERDQNVLDRGGGDLLYRYVFNDFLAYTGCPKSHV